MEGGLALVHVPSVGSRLENAFRREAEFERRFVGILADTFHSALLLQRFDVLPQIAVERINRTRHRSLAGIDKRDPGLKLSAGEPMVDEAALERQFGAGPGQPEVTDCPLHISLHRSGENVRHAAVGTDAGQVRHIRAQYEMR